MTISHFVGIEIGGTKVQLVLGDNTAQILQRIRLAVDRDEGAEGIRRQIEQALPQLLQAETVSALCVGFGGPVDWQTGRIARSHQIEGWSDFNLAGWLRQASGLPVKVDNDANVAALGEARRGAGIGFSSVFYVTLGSGVGGGLVVENRLYHGAAPGESELGHIRLDRKGTILESRCSGWAVDARLREAAAKNPKRKLSQLVGAQKGAEAKHLAAALAAKDLDAERILKDTVGDLAFGLSHVVHLFHPAIIILGGGLSLVGEPLRYAVESALPPCLMEVFRPGPIIALSALGEDAVPVGALELARA